MVLHVGIEATGLFHREQILEKASYGLGSKPCSSEIRVEIPSDRVGVFLRHGEYVAYELAGVFQTYRDILIALASHLRRHFRRVHILQPEREETTRLRSMQIGEEISGVAFPEISQCKPLSFYRVHSKLTIAKRAWLASTSIYNNKFQAYCGSGWQVEIAATLGLSERIIERIYDASKGHLGAATMAQAIQIVIYNDEISAEAIRMGETGWARRSL